MSSKPTIPTKTKVIRKMSSKRQTPASRKAKPERKERVSEPKEQPLKLKKITPLTASQQTVFDNYDDGLNLFLYGCAGTGKSYVALWLALRDVMNSETPYRKVYMVRSAVSSRPQGFLPGTPQEKMAVYESPYVAMLKKLFGDSDGYTKAVKRGLFEVISTSFLRGETFDQCIVIADEIQNCTFHELDTVITRVGNNTRVILCGDIDQCDLIRNKQDVSGLPEFMRILEEIESFEFTEFQEDDIVRGGLVKDYIIQKRKLSRAAA